MTDEKKKSGGFSLFAGDRVLWIIVAALVIISILVVYSSTAKMGYNPRDARTTAGFLKQHLIVLLAICVPGVNMSVKTPITRPKTTPGIANMKNRIGIRFLMK